MKQVDWKKAGSWAVFFLVIGFISYYGLYRMAGKCLVEFNAGGDYDFFFYFGMTVSFGMVFSCCFRRFAPVSTSRWSSGNLMLNNPELR